MLALKLGRKVSGLFIQIYLSAMKQKTAKTIKNCVNAVLTGIFNRVFHNFTTFELNYECLFPDGVLGADYEFDLIFSL